MGVISGITIDGSLTLSDLTISTEGTFNIQANGIDLFSNTILPITIKNYYLSITFPIGMVIFI